MANSTQEHLSIADIKQDLVIMKSGDVALILQTSAVNFGLLSEEEQIAIIASFAGMLNSLSFPIQILIRSKRLNISSYLQRLDSLRSHQKNPLLSSLMLHYRNFIERIIRENEVLDKQFYVIIPLWSYEVGLLKSSANFMKKALTTLLPRRDHLIRQLARVGLQSKQLTSVELINLFYDIYNNQPTNDPQQAQELPSQNQTAPAITPSLGLPKPTVKTPPTAIPQQPLNQAPLQQGRVQNTQSVPTPKYIHPGQTAQPNTTAQRTIYNQPIPSSNIATPPQPVSTAQSRITTASQNVITPAQYAPIQQTYNPYPQVKPQQYSMRPAPPQNGTRMLNPNTPFVVEELKDEYGTV